MYERPQTCVVYSGVYSVESPAVFQLWVYFDASVRRLLTQLRQMKVRTSSTLRIFKTCFQQKLLLICGLVSFGK